MCVDTQWIQDGPHPTFALSLETSDATDNTKKGLRSLLFTVFMKLNAWDVCVCVGGTY
jgi:hypothetical protein